MRSAIVDLTGMLGSKLVTVVPFSPMFKSQNLAKDLGVLETEQFLQSCLGWRWGVDSVEILVGNIIKLNLDLGPGHSD